MDVRAAVSYAAGQPLVVETVQLEGPKAGEVLVEIKATGICHTDEFTRSGADPEGLFPAIFGHEGAGVVVDVGAPLSHAIIVSRAFGLGSAAQMCDGSKFGKTSAPTPPSKVDWMNPRRVWFFIKL